MIISLENITKEYGSNTIFEGVSVQINGDDRIGLIGANGIGKSTLCQIIAGENKEFKGKVVRKPGIDIGYYRQLYKKNDQTLKDQTIYDYMLLSQKDILQIEKKYFECARLLVHDTSPQALQQFSKYQELYNKNEIYNLTDRIEEVLNNFGISRNADGERKLSWSTSIGALSGGERKIVELASILIRVDKDLIILDEPMTHLDQKAKDWLDEFIKNYKGAILLVSHDRYTLNHSVNKIWTIKQKKLYSCKGNYTNYLKEEKILKQRMVKDWQVFKKEKNKKGKHLKQIKDWVNKSHSEKMQRLYVVWKRKYEKFLKTEPTDPEVLETKFILPKFSIPKSGNICIRFRNTNFKYENKTIFHNLNILIGKGEKVALEGPNGAGKTTLFKIILSRYCYNRKIDPASYGIQNFYSYYINVIKLFDLYIGPSYQIGYYDQQHNNLKPEITIGKFLNYQGIHKIEEIFSVLKDFGFDKVDRYKYISDLSGGEKSRLQFIKIIQDKPNLLLLDEPINHLDIKAKEIVHKFLSEYKGNYIIVSHDRYLTQKTCTKFYEINNYQTVN